MIEYVDAQKWYMTFCLNAAPISSRVRFFIGYLGLLDHEIDFEINLFFSFTKVA